MIHETVVTTCSPDGQVHIAPMGAVYQGRQVVLQPFKPSTTLSNVLATGSAVLNLLTDVRVFAGCVTGRRDFSTVEVAAPVAGTPARRLACALGHATLRLVEHRDDVQRPVLTLQRVDEATHAPFPGMNRAQAAVLEGAVLVSRLHLLPAEKIDREFGYLQIAIDKTAGPLELEAWGWLREAVERHRAAADGRGAAA